MHERLLKLFVLMRSLHVCFHLKNIITCRHLELLTNPEQRQQQHALTPMMIACEYTFYFAPFYLHSKGATRLTININVIFIRSFGYGIRICFKSIINNFRCVFHMFPALYKWIIAISKNIEHSFGCKKIRTFHITFVIQKHSS